MKKHSKFLGETIAPRGADTIPGIDLLVEGCFKAYNAARLNESCRLFAEKMLEDDVTVGMSVSGALTPAGLGRSCLVPLIKRGFVDWIVSTGANLYHDTHFALGLTFHAGRPNFDDTELWKEGVVRIYDVVFRYEVLLETDAFFRALLQTKEFSKPMPTSEFHYKVGKVLAEREEAAGLKDVSLLAAAYRYGVPIYVSSPGDSSIGMNCAAMQFENSAFNFDVLRDVNETSALVWDAKRKGGKSAVFILGGGSPKNFMLQTEPQIREVLGFPEEGQDYFLQITDARPDTGGLSGATPSEAVSWGKVDPKKLPDSVVCYTDTTIALPIMTAYAASKRKARKPKRLYDRKDAITGEMQKLYLKNLAAGTADRGNRGTVEPPVKVKAAHGNGAAKVSRSVDRR